MNFTESFQEFSSKLSTMDLALYAGIGLVLWVLFKDKLSPVQKILGDLISSVKNSLGNHTGSVVPVIVPETKPVIVSSNREDTFFKLVVSWKQTRDLAVQSGCSKAVEVADQMFPYLSPNICGDNKQDTTK
jgi:hypothetical protein